MRFGKGHAYNSRLNKHNKKIGEFWFSEGNEQLAFQEKEQKDAILKNTKKEMGVVINGTALEEKVREKEKNLANTDDQSYLTSLNDDKLLIPPEPRSLPMIKFFLLKKDFNQALLQKPRFISLELNHHNPRQKTAKLAL